MNWLMNGINEIMIIVFGVVQLLSIVILWLYILEGVSVEETIPYESYRKNSSALYWVSAIAFFIMWFCILNNTAIVMVLSAFTLLWMISVIVFLAISIKIQNMALKSNIRVVMMTAIRNMIIIAVIAWVIHV